MVRVILALAWGASCVALAGCGGHVSADAAQSVERFLKAAADDDRPAFEAAVDRPALRDDLRRQLVDVAKVEGLEVDGGPSDYALDRMIGPEALHLVQAEAGAALPRTPTAAQIEAMIKVLGSRRVCLHAMKDPKRCLLTFAKARRGGPWRLVGMQAMDPAAAQVGLEPVEN